MKKLIAKYWPIAALVIVTVGVLFYGNHYQKTKTLLQEQRSAIVEYYSAVEDYKTVKTENGLLIFSLVEDEFNSKNVYLVSPKNLKELSINEKVYKIHKNGTFIKYDNWNWYTIEVPKADLNEFFK